MSAWTPVANPDGSTNTHGYFYPWPNGWPTLPESIAQLPGSVSFEDETSPTGVEWFVIKGSPAYNAWVLGQTSPISRGLEIVRARDGSRAISVSPGTVVPVVKPTTTTTGTDTQSGEGDPVPEYTNDPALGVVPIGVPTDQTFLRKLWNAPARAVAKVLPPGSVSEGVALGLTVMPWLIWGAVAFWIWRRVRR